MQDLIGLLSNLRRPRLLIRAARFGAQDYSRNRHLRRLLGYGALPRSGPALIRLMELEADLDTARQTGGADYSVARHLDILIAMMGEAKLLRATHLAPIT
jgi:hypothetical protein